MNEGSRGGFTLIGKVFNNRYVIREKLGSGGTSIVYRGQDNLLGRMVTIKILREEYASNEDFVRRFRREAQAVASLNHGNIVAVYDVGYEENMHYIVMEFVEGESLKEYIKRRGALPLDEACNIITQILSGIQYAHEHGIIHRDIKPHNILLSRDGRAKVTDFGIAVGMSDVTLTYNTTSRIMGSVHYISPEQVQGQPVTEKSDIYSVGVVFYEMLTGRLPYSGDAPISIAMQHVQGEPILPHQLNPAIPMSLSYVVMRAMRKNPETRFDSARDMADTVRSVVIEMHMAAAQNQREDYARGLEDDYETGFDDGELNQSPRPRRGLFPDKKRMFLFVGMLLLAVVLIVVTIQLVGLLTGGGNEVPELLGWDIADAEAELQRLGIRYTIVERVSEATEEGLVLAQSVKAGEVIDKDRSVTLTVGKGAAKVEVPNVTGYTEHIGELTLRNAGFVVKREEEYDPEVPAGQIISQYPLSGEEADSGSEVLIVVSLGKEAQEISMPQLIGSSLDEAREAISDAGLVVESIDYASSYEYNSGIVIAQSVDAETKVMTGSGITITVSEGPGPQEKTATYTYYVADRGRYQQVKITVEDANGVKTIYDELVPPGGQWITQEYTYYNSATIRVEIDGEAVHSEYVS